ncbi:type III toxin-antitoxin system ToxN/AbiQ family toxin [Burkholderia gladioli]|uniref:type III toxin-antitoxin system ToxN/AbiQ family toxin n=1 Tax=Burkholderia gladioli TaxID=28095 RepID=UPI00164075B3|nr:type III toxin-antitoxin system ToxN/AbiQ family toxin [Burkholderia gladioli]
MEFYTVSDKYIAYLKSIDTTVPDNYSEQRAYIGVILEVGGHKYLAPLTSYKPKQDRIDSSNPSVFKLHEKGVPDNKLGMVAINNMFPILDSEITRVDFASQSGPYRRMLTLQLAFIKSNQDQIKTRAETLHKLVCQNAHKFFTSISCKFAVLEANYRQYQQQMVPTADQSVPGSLPASEQAE